eukprot:scaffold3699_cov56-Phaeocystis_antarctica.AAC.1
MQRCGRRQRSWTNGSDLPRRDLIGAHQRAGQSAPRPRCEENSSDVGHRPVYGAARNTGFERYCPPTRVSSRVHRACADGRASTCHLHGITERAARCDTVKVPAESAGAVAR